MHKNLNQMKLTRYLKKLTVTNIDSRISSASDIIAPARQKPIKTPF